MKFSDIFLLVLIVNMSVLLQNAVLADEEQSRIAIVNRELSPLFRRGCFTLGKESRETLCEEGYGNEIKVDQPPKFVYRADFRPPTVVFQKGMESLGRNDDLLEHMTGVSAHYGSKKNSLFVSTSENKSMAIKWAESQMKKNQRTPIYVYEIRANDNYFSMYQSLMNAFLLTQDKQYKTQANHVAKFYSEWEACGWVKAKEIVNATEYQRDESNNPQSSYLTAVGTETNNKYAKEETEGNQNYFVPRCLRIEVI